MRLKLLLGLFALCLICGPNLRSSSAQQPAPAAAPAGNWRLVGPIGPMRDADGSDVGRINSFTFRPNDQQTIYAATPAGGLWRTQDDGASWKQVATFDKRGIQEIVIDPQTPDTMYVLTGDGDGVMGMGALVAPASVGILKSIDAGETWQPTGLTFAPTDNQYGFRLAIDPAMPAIMLAATTKGLLRTTDGWQTSAQVTDGILPADAKAIFYDVVFHPADPSVVYAATKNQVYRSIDTGATWAPLTAGLPAPADLVSSSTANNPNASNRIRLAVTPASPDTLYVLYGANNGFTIGLYRSDDRGASFSKRASTAPVSSDPNAPLPIDMTKANVFGRRDNDFASQSNYDIALAVSPAKADVVHLGGIDTWATGNGGLTWSRTSHWDTNPQSPQYVHADVHMLAYRGTSLFAATDGGIYRTDDEASSWRNVTQMTTGITIAQIYHVCSSAKEPDVFYYGAQDNGSYRLEIDGDTDKVGGGDGFICQVDPQNPNTLYITEGNGILRTDDAEHAEANGPLWTFINPIASGAPVTGPWVTPYILSPDPRSAFGYDIYACFGDLWRSTDRGVSWRNLTNGVTGTNSSDCQQVAVSPADPRTIYIAKAVGPKTQLLAGGGVFRSRDGGASWTSITGNLPVTAASITDLAVSPTDPQRVWVSFSGYVYNADAKVFGSTDGGQTWVDLSAGLPTGVPANALAAAGGAANGVYVGLGEGVYYRDDTLGRWVPFKNGLPDVLIMSLLIQQPQHRIVVATYGRGVWMSDMYPQ